jgi:hypothetical protein
VNTRGPCSGCGSPLAIDQRYCVECGQRVGPPLAMPYVPARSEAAAVAAGSGGILSSLPMPLQTAATLAALALGFGVIAGTAITPNLAATVAGTVVVQAPAPAAPAEPVDAGGGGGGGGGADIVEDVVAEETLFEETVEEAPETGGGEESKEPEPEPVFASGIVVHVNPVAQSYALAAGGSVTPVHTKKALPPLGTQVRVPVAELANQTSLEDGKRRLNGQVAAATFSGVVTYNSDSVDPQIRDTYSVSSRGASILVHSPQDATLGTIGRPPPVGSFVTVLAAISDTVAEPALDVDLEPSPDPDPAVPVPPAPACAPPPKPLPDPPLTFAKSLYETSMTIDAPAAEVDSSDIAGVIQAVCAPEGRLLLSADDVRESKADLFDPITGSVLQAAPGVDLSGFAPGEAVIANADLVEDSDPATPPGTKIPAQITGIRSDTGVSGADRAGG